MTNPHQAELDRLRRELREARDELDAWQAGSSRNTRDEVHRARIEKLRNRLGIQLLSTARFALALYDAGRPMSYEALDEAVPPVTSSMRDNHTFFASLACYLRRSLGKDALVTLRGWGYDLTPAAREKIAATLAETQ